MGPAGEVDAGKLIDKEARDKHGEETHKSNEAGAKKDKSFELAYFFYLLGHKVNSENPGNIEMNFHSQGPSMDKEMRCELVFIRTAR